MTAHCLSLTSKLLRTEHCNQFPSLFILFAHELIINKFQNQVPKRMMNKEKKKRKFYQSYNQTFLFVCFCLDGKAFKNKVLYHPICRIHTMIDATYLTWQYRIIRCSLQKPSSPEQRESNQSKAAEGWKWKRTPTTLAIILRRKDCYGLGEVSSRSYELSHQLQEIKYWADAKKRHTT